MHAEIELVHQPRHEEEAPAPVRHQVRDRLCVEAGEIEALAFISHDGNEIGSLEAQTDLDVLPRAAVADRIGARFFDGQHDIVDLLRVERRELQVSADAGADSEQPHGLGR